ncbi:MAG: tRNA pseudouridine(38-40) synthase TruA [Eubacteriales bacterium]|nr:tRNA pseudouridine(38-40) synthase TruA [Eubacteriales bacterium]MDY3332199.1 tRNA pseudouridine(38-40) synthase TruA [Gallibacter sp.]
MNKRNILLKIQYDGTNYCGWQRQPEEVTVQGEIERALSILCAQEITINGCSRTDTGVHAFSQMASFIGEFAIPTENIKYALNNLVNDDIYISDVIEVDEEFHARFNCIGKKYRYEIINSVNRDPFYINRAYFVRKPLNFENMRKAAGSIVGKKDFASFQAAGSNPRETTVRTIYNLDLIEEDYPDGRKLVIEVAGDGFLYNMVRIIVGTLVDVGLGRIESSEVKDIIASCDRTKAGHTAPPQGLYLKEVYYE